MCADNALPRLRALFGTDNTYNAMHGSDSSISAARELQFFFPHLCPPQIPDERQSEQYVQEQLTPCLVEGLTELARTKPSSDPTVAIQWLGTWLHDHNPSKASTQTGPVELAGYRQGFWKPSRAFKSAASA